MSQHLAIVPLLAPLLATALMVLTRGERRRTVVVLAFVSVAIQFAAAATLAAGDPVVYRIGDWPAPFAIVLVADHLGLSLMLMTHVIAAASLCFATAYWHRAAVHFHPLMQLLLLGVNGAFLTGDLFNLFVFIEVMLAASYGLVLHAFGFARVRAALHYVAYNLVASMLLLVGIALIFGATGALNFADLAVRVPELHGTERMLFDSGAALVGVALLAKAAVWPLCFWLPTAYEAASVPCAALMAVMSKVGVYAVLRLSLFAYDTGGGEPAEAVQHFLFYAGMATLAYGMFGVLSAQRLGRLTSFLVLVSSGTAFAALGIAGPDGVAAVLYYMLSSTVAIAALFLLGELAERGRAAVADILAVTREAFHVGEVDDEHVPEGSALPGMIALLGALFVACALVLAGLPPLSGFVAKFALLDVAFAGAVDGRDVAFVALMIVSGLATLIATTRSGYRLFWSIPKREIPAVRAVEAAPVVALLFVGLALTLAASSVMDFLTGAAVHATEPARYVERVLGGQP